MIRAILFDLGNTLLEAEARPFRELFQDAAALLHASLTARQVDLPDAERFVGEFEDVFSALEDRAGEANSSVVRRSVTTLLERYGVNLSSEELREALYPFYEAMSQQVVEYPDTLRSLVELKQSGMRLGIVANTIWPKEFHLRDLARVELLSLIDVLVFSSDVGIEKPSPEIFQRALDLLEVEAEEAVFVGDSVAEDIAGAQAAGIRAIQKFHPRAAKNNGPVRPDGHVEALNQLPALLETWNPAIA